MLLAGATGVVGRECLRLLSDDPSVAEIRALVRRPLSPDSCGPRVRQQLADFDRLESHGEWFRVSRVFCALGTTMKQAGSRDAFRRVDYDYPLAVAQLALRAGATHFLLVSALGANSESRVFYNRVKGEIETAICGLGFRAVTIVRPSFLLGDRKEPRLGEAIGRRLGFLLPPRYRQVPAWQVAAALVYAARVEASGIRVIENAELRSRLR